MFLDGKWRIHLTCTDSISINVHRQRRQSAHKKVNDEIPLGLYPALTEKKIESGHVAISREKQANLFFSLNSQS